MHLKRLAARVRTRMLSLLREIRRYRRNLFLHMLRGVAYGAGTTAVGLIALWWQTKH